MNTPMQISHNGINFVINNEVLQGKIYRFLMRSSKSNGQIGTSKRKWVAEELEILKAAYTSGNFDLEQVAAQIGRSTKAVELQLYRLYGSTHPAKTITL